MVEASGPQAMYRDCRQILLRDNDPLVLVGAEPEMPLLRWSLSTAGHVAPEERLPWGQTLLLGFQHVIAMFGGTTLGPILMGFDPNTAIFFSGIGTLLFFAITGGRVPSYLGSSFSFIGVVIAATAYAGHGPNPNIGLALGGIVAAGAVYAAIGLVVQLAGARWIEHIMPPIVTGAIVAAIGLNLAPVAVQDLGGSSFNTAVGLLTLLATTLIAVSGPGLLQRFPILLGAAAGYLIYFAGANGFGLGTPIDFSRLHAAPWLGLPNFQQPVFSAPAMVLIAPVAIVLVAENLGHIKALAVMAERNFDALIGRAFFSDGIATVLSGFGGGTGVTTYAENMGVMAVTRVYSTLVFVTAACAAILFGFSPKFGALIMTLPTPVMGGVGVVVFGLIAATGARIWIMDRVDFTRPRNLLTAGIALIAGGGNLSVQFGDFTLSGIGSATFGTVLIYHLLNERGFAGDRAGEPRFSVRPGDTV